MGQALSEGEFCAAHWEQDAGKELPGQGPAVSVSAHCGHPPRATALDRRAPRPQETLLDPAQGWPAHSPWTRASRAHAASLGSCRACPQLMPIEGFQSERPRTGQDVDSLPWREVSRQQVPRAPSEGWGSATDPPNPPPAEHRPGPAPRPKDALHWSSIPGGTREESYLRGQLSGQSARSWGPPPPPAGTGAQPAAGAPPG